MLSAGVSYARGDAAARGELGVARTPKWDPQPGLSQSGESQGAGLCKAAPAPRSAGSHLALSTLKGKWIFSTPASQSKLVGTPLPSLAFPASRSCWGRTKQLPLSNRLPRRGFFSSVLEKKTLRISPLHAHSFHPGEGFKRTQGCSVLPNPKFIPSL